MKKLWKALQICIVAVIFAIVVMGFTFRVSKVAGADITVLISTFLGDVELSIPELL